MDSRITRIMKMTILTMRSHKFSWIFRHLRSIQFRVFLIILIKCLRPRIKSRVLLQILPFISLTTPHYQDLECLLRIGISDHPRHLHSSVVQACTLHWNPISLTITKTFKITIKPIISPKIKPTLNPNVSLGKICLLMQKKTNLLITKRITLFQIK